MDTDEKVAPVEKMRIRMAAEGYQGYKTLENDADESESEHGSKEMGKHGKDAKTGGPKRVCSNFDTVMAVLLILSLLVILVLSVLLVVQGFVKDKKSTKSCQTAECVEMSASVLQRMDLSAAPCEDFYAYACGNFANDPMIPPEEAKHSQFSTMSRRTTAIVKKLLEDTHSSVYMGEHSTAIEKAKLVYSTCMNTTATENMGIDPLLKLIGEVGSWTVTSDDLAGEWSESDFSIESSVALKHSYDIGTLFEIGVSQDDEDSSTNIIKFDQGGLSFSDHTHYTGNDTDKYRTAFVEFFTEIAELLGAPSGEATRQLGEDIWDFETKIAKAMDTPEQRVDIRKIYNKMTLQELQHLIDPSTETKFNLGAYMSMLFKKEIPATETVVVYSLNYFGNLSKLIEDTKKETIANYMAFGVVQSMVNYMPQSFQTVNNKLRQVLLGVSESSPKWLKCSSRASGTLGFAVGAMYTEKHFSEDDKEYINSLLDRIVSQFDRSLTGVTWMDNETRDKAKEKLADIGRKIGYPGYIKHPDELDKHYENLTITNETSFENARNAMKFAAETWLLRLDKKPDPEQWSMKPTEINAYYSPTHNEMVFPAGILSEPFYSSAFSSAMNYGSMGFIMGHELTHGFDTTGRLFDTEGNLDNWWTDKSATQFEEKTQCLIDQYNSYKVQDTHLNGITTLGENIADNGGLKTSYAAYQKWLKSHNYVDPNSNLPGLNVTRNQLFFLAFAQTWCTYMTPEYEKAAIVTDVHSNPKYRVIGTLSNNADFAEAYQCKLGSPLNPVHKCSVW